MVSGPGGTAYQSQADAVWTPAGLLQTWSNPDVYIHAGLSAGGDVGMGELGSSSVYEPAFGYDAVAGRLYVVTACLATGKEGLWARPVSSATGAGLGPWFELSKSWTAQGGSRGFDPQLTRTPAAGLAGVSAVLVAYPAGYPETTSLRVWRLTPGGQSTALLASGGAAKSATAVCADPNGRAWVVWTTQSGTRRHVYARRSNVGATAWGKTVSLVGPSGSATLWQLSACAQADRVDVLGLFGVGSGDVIYHTQLRRGLSVTASPASLKVGRTTTLTVSVTDAGAGVGGATVKVAGKSATTSVAGRAKVTVRVAKAGKVTVSVAKAGYAAGSARVTAAR